MTDNQWQVIEGLIPVLKPLYMATRVMCSEEYPTLSGACPIIFSIIYHHMKADNSDIPAVRKFKSFLIDDVKERFGLTDDRLDETCRGLLMCATFLDPRYRSLPFLSVEKTADCCRKC
ncbi:hypothetical protein KUTeg_017565 [Tegillarca granosa]|uniref:Uncharacterized protein n=1 Tax=Tegillarca granosa TaxID=220873 RepID=A0ABQ9EFA6_TEGGR|nr:hypothetical protein KUTeg_017565 [Tegillarca granosa]